MTLKAAFFDVGDTLVEHWAPREVTRKIARAQIRAGLGEPPWLDDLLAADLEPVATASLAHQISVNGRDKRFEPQWSRQDTHEWLRAWFRGHGIEADGVDVDRLRSLMCVPLAEISTPVRGAFDAVRWCADRGLRVVLVTNTLQRGDAEVLEDRERLGLAGAIHGVVSSHSAGWRKPHPSIFERALEIAGADPADAFHVGDNLITDVYGARQLGMRAVWRRKEGGTSHYRRDERTSDPEICGHPSDDLSSVDGTVRCAGCGRDVDIDVRPDAVIDDLTELPDVVRRWLA